jgi:hypothetical protein
MIIRKEMGTKMLVYGGTQNIYLLSIVWPYTYCQLFGMMCDR